MKNKKKWIWISLAVIAVLIVVGYFFGPNLLSTINGGGVTGARAQDGRPDLSNMPTIKIRPATDTAQVSAAGNIDVVGQYSAMLRVAGIITEWFAWILRPVRHEHRPENTFPGNELRMISLASLTWFG